MVLLTPPDGAAARIAVDPVDGEEEEDDGICVRLTARGAGLVVLRWVSSSGCCGRLSGSLEWRWG